MRVVDNHSFGSGAQSSPSRRQAKEKLPESAPFPFRHSAWNG